MKKIRFILVLLALTLAFGLALVSCDNGSTNNQGTTLVCLGDSLTTGHGATTPGRDDKSKSYPAYLQNKINIPVINAGVSGDRSAQALARVDSEVLSQNPQIVIILLGGNDLGIGFPVTFVKSNLQSIIDKINNGSRKIYLAKFYTAAMLKDMTTTDGDAFTATINQWDNMFSSLASENNLTLIEDIWQGVWGIHMSDNIHPNARGYEIMANNIFNVLQPYLQANNLIKQ